LVLQVDRTIWNECMIVKSLSIGGKKSTASTDGYNIWHNKPENAHFVYFVLADCVAKLRNKLGSWARSHIVTESGIGYRIEDSE